MATEETNKAVGYDFRQNSRLPDNTDASNDTAVVLGGFSHAVSYPGSGIQLSGQVLSLREDRVSSGEYTQPADKSNSDSEPFLPIPAEMISQPQMFDQTLSANSEGDEQALVTNLQQIEK